jgi:hypothetical protein
MGKEELEEIVKGENMDEYENNADQFWKQVISQTMTGGCTGEQPFLLRKKFENRSEVPHPSHTKILKWSIGELKPEPKTDWRASFSNREEGFHAVEFDDRYECHIDKFDSNKHLLNHLIHDSPPTLASLIVAGVVLTAGGILYYFYKEKEAEEDECGQED